jgi:hypothetical protein
VKASDSGQEMAVRFVDIGGIVDHHCERWSFVLLILVELLTIIVRGDCSFCWYWWNCWLSLWEVIARFVDIGGIVDHHCERRSFVLLILVELLTIIERLSFVLLILVELLTIIVRGDRSFCWNWWNYWPSLWEVIARVVNIGGTVDHHCERRLFVLLILVELLTIIGRGDCPFCWYWWNCWPSLWEGIVRFVDHHCERWSFVLLVELLTIIVSTFFP